MAAAPASSAPPARAPCSPAPAPCPVPIHHSSPALPYKGTLHFRTFPALGKPGPKGAFSCALPPAPSAPPAPVQEQVTDQPCPTQPQFPRTVIPCHQSHHRCRPHARVPFLCSNPTSFPCLQMMAHVQQRRLARQRVPADRSTGKRPWCSSLSPRGHLLLRAEKLEEHFPFEVSNPLSRLVPGGQKD